MENREQSEQESELRALRESNNALQDALATAEAKIGVLNDTLAAAEAKIRVLEDALEKAEEDNLFFGVDSPNFQLHHKSADKYDGKYSSRAVTQV